MVYSNKDGIIEATGLSDVAVGDMVAFDDNRTLLGFVASLEREFVKIVVLGDDKKIYEGDPVIALREPVTLSVDQDALPGRISNGLGHFIAGGGVSGHDVRGLAPEIITRKSVNESLTTGTLIIDALISIGRGRRELIIGDCQMGKSTIAIDTFIHSENMNLRAASSNNLKLLGHILKGITLNQKKYLVPGGP
ncbi:MAG: hypothetical protein M3Q64_02910 [bacterium]|nr:hypothetical protein [bacterium]